MMKNKTKICFAGILSLLSVCAIGTGVSFAKNIEANAEEVAAIEMKDGAQVRIVGDAAIRFTAYLSDASATAIQNGTATAGMIIVPDSYMDKYEAQTTITDYYTYFTSKQHFLFTYGKEQLVTTDSRPSIRGAIDEILYENLDREFIAIAYVDDGTTKTYAQVDRDNARSVSYVSSAAINDNKSSDKLYECLKKTSYKKLGVTYDATAEDEKYYVWNGNNYTYEELSAQVDYTATYNLAKTSLSLEPHRTASLQTEALKGVDVQYISSDTNVATVDENGTVTAVGEGNAIITAKIGNATKNFVEKTCTVSVAYTNYAATIEELKNGFTYDWEYNYMEVQGGVREEVADITDATAKSAIEGASEGFSSGAVMHVTGTDRHTLYGFTRTLGNMQAGYTYNIELHYYGVNVGTNYIIALNDAATNHTLMANPLSNGLHTLTFEYVPSADEFALIFYPASSTFDVYFGELTITRAATKYYAATNEDMQAEGGYTYDWKEDALLKIESNAEYVKVSEVGDATLKTALQNTNAFTNGYALKYAGTSSSYVSCLRGTLTEGATYTLTFDAYEVTRGSACVLLMNSAGTQAGRVNYTLTNNANGTVRYTTSFTATSDYYSVNLYIISACELYLANFTIAMEIPVVEDTLTEVQISGTKTASDCDTYAQGTLVDTPAAVSGQKGFGAQSYKLVTKTDDPIADLFDLSDVTVNDEYYKSIQITIYYYMEEATTGLYLCMVNNGNKFQAIDGSAGYHAATYTFDYTIGHFCIHAQGGLYGVMYIGSVDYVVTTMRDVSDTSLVERTDYAGIPFESVTSTAGYTYDFSENNALEIGANTEYRLISGMPEGALKNALLNSGAFTSGYALRLNGMGDSQLKTLNYNLVPGYTYTLSFKAYQVTAGNMYLLPMGGQQDGQLSFTITSDSATGLYDYSVKFTAEKNWLRLNMFITTECDLYIAYFNVKATADTAHVAVNVAENAFLAENATAALSTLGYANSNAIAVTPSSATAGVWVTTDALANYEAGASVHVSFRLKPVSTQVWANVNVYDGNGTLIDYAYPANGWSFVNYDATVVEKEGVKYVYVGLNNAASELCYLSEVAVDGNTTPMSNLFGGTKLIQIANAGVPQMQGYLFKTTDNKLAIFDGGTTAEAASLHEQIVANAQKNSDNKYVIDAWFISHYHSDHVGALIQVLKTYDDIAITTLYYDFDGASESQGDADYSYVTDLKSALTTYASKVGTVVTPKQKDAYTIGAITVKVLNDAYFNASSNIVNNSSIVFKVETAGESVLLLADLGNYGDTLLADEYFLSEIKTCRVIQMAHHGQAGVSDAVYKAIDDIRICLYPAPAWLYDVYNTTGTTGTIGSGTYGTLATRTLMRALGVRYSYSMKNGVVTLG